MTLEQLHKNICRYPGLKDRTVISSECQFLAVEFVLDDERRHQFEKAIKKVSGFQYKTIPVYKLISQNRIHRIDALNVVAFIIFPKEKSEDINIRGVIRQ